jgi:hypothetical protein
MDSVKFKENRGSTYTSLMVEFYHSQTNKIANDLLSSRACVPSCFRTKNIQVEKENAYDWRCIFCKICFILRILGRKCDVEGVHADTSACFAGTSLKKAPQNGEHTQIIE